MADITTGKRRVDELPGRADITAGLGCRTSCPAGRRACMEALYRIPFGQFERYCPCGSPAEIAASLQPYVDSGCRSFKLIPVADSEQAAIEGADAVRTALQGSTDD